MFDDAEDHLLHHVLDLMLRLPAIRVVAFRRARA